MAGNKSRHPSVFFPCGRGSSRNGWEKTRRTASTSAVVGLVKVANAGGMGSLGAEQLAWLADDLKGTSASTPIVLFAHIPVWTVAAAWGWGTDHSAAALGFVKRFGSVTVLNGDIHRSCRRWKAR
jgi:Icc protein